MTVRSAALFAFAIALAAAIRGHAGAQEFANGATLQFQSVLKSREAPHRIGLALIGNRPAADQGLAAMRWSWHEQLQARHSFVVQQPEPASQPNEAPPPRLNLRELGIIPPLAAGEGGEPATVTASFRIVEGTQRGTLAVAASIDPGWHVYSLTQPVGGPRATKIKVAEAVEFKQLGPFQPDRPPHIRPPGGDNPFQVNVEEHEERVTWTAPIELTEGVQPEELRIGVDVEIQVCKQECLQLSKQLTAKFAGYDQPPATPGEYRPDPDFEAQVVLSGHLEPAAVAPGGEARLKITAAPTPGWHIYAYAPVDPDEIAKPTLIVLSSLPAGWTRSPAVASAEPKVEPAKAGQPATRSHEEPVTWTITLGIPAGAPEGEHGVSGYIGYQTCKNQGGCLPPQVVQFTASVPVGSEQPGQIPLAFAKPQRGAPAARGGNEPAAPASEVRNYNHVAKLARQAAASAPPAAGDSAEPLSPGVLALSVVLGLVGGFILNFMPCVLPTVGLKMLSFAQQGGENRGRVFALNFSFFCGLMAVFLTLALLASVVNLLWGEQFTHTWFKVAMIVVTFAMALSFLGVWEIPIPGFSTSGGNKQEEGLTGAFLKGILATLLATPCSGPLLGPIWFYAGTSAVLAFVLFGSIGLGMGLPYLVIGAFPSLVRWLPKPGPWMETFKQLMGFVLLFTVVYFFASVPSYYIPVLATVIGVWLACWWIGRVPLYEPTAKQIQAWIGGCAAAVLIGWLSFSWFGPRSAEKEIIAWQPYSSPQLAASLSAGKTVMIDFTANWCPTCQWNTLTAIETPKVKALVEKNGVVPLLADWTEYSPEIKAKLLELQSRSIPLLAIYPAGRPEEVIVLRDVVTEQQVMEALEKAGPSKPATGQQVASVKEGAE
jgi:thiol:disulfide interchange protein